MQIQKINNVWYIIDKTHKTVTRDHLFSRCIANALNKHIAYKGTVPVIGNDIQEIMTILLRESHTINQ